MQYLPVPVCPRSRHGPVCRILPLGASSGAARMVRGRRRGRRPRPHTSVRASRHPAMREETERDAETTLDIPPAPHARRPIGLAAPPVGRVAAARASSARGGRLAGARAAPHAVGHGPGSAAAGLAVTWGPDLVRTAGALLGTPGAVLGGAGAHGRGRRGAPRARGGSGARGAPDPRASGPGRAGCGWRAESERARGLSRASQGHGGRALGRLGLRGGVRPRRQTCGRGVGGGTATAGTRGCR